jgi:Complex I intermediate-associated protein 30 (CIA30).
MDGTLIILLCFSVLFLLLRFHWSSSSSIMSRNGNTSQDVDGLFLFDFRKLSDLDHWTEESDTVREVGKSKAVFQLQKTRLFQRAIFFTLLNPQENGAGFAGCRTNTNFDFSKYEKLQVYGRAQGSNAGECLNVPSFLFIRTFVSAWAKDPISEVYTSQNY